MFVQNPSLASFQHQVFLLTHLRDQAIFKQKLQLCTSPILSKYYFREIYGYEVDEYIDIDILSTTSNPCYVHVSLHANLQASLDANLHNIQHGLVTQYIMLIHDFVKFSFYDFGEIFFLTKIRQL